MVDISRYGAAAATFPVGPGGTAMAGSARRYATVTPSDSTDLVVPADAFRITGAGNIKCRGSDGVEVTFAVVANETTQWGAVRVLATGTTATGIIALYVE